MKALSYTLILSAVLVGCLALLLSLDKSKTPSPARTGPPPLLSSRLAAAGKFNLSGLESATAQELMNSGLELYDLWLTREAAQLFERVLAKDSTFLDACLKLTECYADPLVCREDEARQNWRRAQTLAAGRAEDTLFVQAVGDLYVRADYGGAARRFEALVKSGHRPEDDLFYLASALLKEGDLENAEKNLRQLLQTDESNGRAHELLVRCAVLSGALDEAESLAKNLAVLYSDEPFPYVLLSRVLDLAGRPDEALSFCQNALSLDPRFIPAILEQGNLYASRGEPLAARISFEKLLLFDDPILASLGSEGIAFVDFLGGRFDDGAEMMDEAVRQAMLVGSVRRGLNYTSRFVDYLLQLGRNDQAKTVIDRWFSGFGDVPYRLGNLKLEIFNGELDIVRAILGKSISDGESMYWMKMLGIDTTVITALISIQERDYSRALESLGDAGPARAGDEEYLYLRGYAAFEKGEAELAAASFKAVLGSPAELEFPYHRNPVFFAQALFYLGEAALARGAQDEAIDYYDRFLSCWGDADWEIPAVGRATEKLRTLQGASADNR